MILLSEMLVERNFYRSSVFFLFRQIDGDSTSFSGAAGWLDIVINVGLAVVTLGANVVFGVDLGKMFRFAK